MSVIADRPSEHPIMLRLSEPGEDRELKAIAYLTSVLDDFRNDERQRILDYLCARFPRTAIQEK